MASDGGVGSLRDVLDSRGLGLGGEGLSGYGGEVVAAVGILVNGTLCGKAPLLLMANHTGSKDDLGLYSEPHCGRSSCSIPLVPGGQKRPCNQTQFPAQIEEIAIYI
jgi:hypothetical protein